MTMRWWRTIEAWTQTCIEWLISPIGHRVEAVIIASMIVVASGWFANHQRMRLISQQRKLKVFRGRKPSTIKGIEKRLNEVNEIKRTSTMNFAFGAAAVAAFGFLIPSIVFAVGLYKFSWLLPNHYGLMRAGCDGASPLQANIGSTFEFMLNQFVMGASPIATELASHRTTAPPVVLEPSNDLLRSFLIGYRYFVGLIATLFLQLIVAAYQARTLIGPVERELLEAKVHATH